MRSALPAIATAWLVTLGPWVVPARAGDERKAPPPVTIRSADEDRPSGSRFLSKPGSSDRYGPKVDWREVPPWRRAEFFGIRTQGRVFVYVVDCSGSMAEDGRLVRAKRELRRSIGELRFPQRFYVIFYNDHPLKMPGGIPQSAEANAKTQLLQWLRLIDADGDTDPRGAMSQAIGLRPDAIFLLSDGEFPDGSAEAIARKNTHRIPIHCVDLSGGAAGDQLGQIARESGGDYTAQP
jgi:hypothetical protein